MWVCVGFWLNDVAENISTFNHLGVDKYTMKYMMYNTINNKETDTDINIPL